MGSKNNDRPFRPSLIGPTVTIRGLLKDHTERLDIMGTIEGIIDHDARLHIHRTATVNAEIQAREVLIDGTASGNIRGSEWVKVNATANVDGNIYSKRFSVEEGARIKGSVVVKTEEALIEPHAQIQSRERKPPRAGTKAFSDSTSFRGQDR